MAKKQVNRKKQLKKQLADLRRAGQEWAADAREKVTEVTEQVAKATGKAVETVSEKAQDVFEVAKEKVEEIKTGAGKFEDFAKDLEGVATARLETFYAEGIKSVKDFAKWTEKELLELKGIGPATIKQLKELGVKLKK